MKFDDAKPRVGKDNVRLADVVDLFKLSGGKWAQIRVLPVNIMPVKEHWVNIIAGKDKREVKIPKICVAFDPHTEGDKKGAKCPYCDLAGAQTSVYYLVNVINRRMQDDEPSKKPKLTADEKSSGLKDPDSNSWTPVQVMRMTSSLMKKIQGLKELNKHKVKGKSSAFSISHARYGVDINVKHDPSAKGAEQYQVNMGDKNALTEEEAAYLVHPLAESILDELGRETPKQAMTEVKRMEIVGEDEMPDEDDDDDDDEDGESLGKKSKKKPAKKSSKPSKKASKYDADEDDEDEEDEEDEDDDEPVAKKKAAKKPSKKSSKYDDDDDDDEDEDDDDDEDEEDEEDEDEEDEDEEDEDEEDEEPVAKKKAAKKPAAKKPVKKSSKKKPADDDDDDDEDDDDDDDDDEDDDDDDDEPVVKKKPTKKSSKPAAKKPVKKSSKKKPADDDYDDDIPF